MAINRINTQEMRSTANMMDQNAASFDAQTLALFQAGEELDGMWSGDAHSTFKAQLSQDQSRFKALNSILTQYAAALREYADEYDRSEAEAVSTLKTNTIRR